MNEKINKSKTIIIKKTVKIIARIKNLVVGVNKRSKSYVQCVIKINILLVSHFSNKATSQSSIPL